MTYEKYLLKHMRKLERKLKRYKGGVNMKSTKWTLNELEIKAILRNAVIFLAPVAVVELELIQRGATIEELLIAFKVWGVGVLLDAFRKFQAGK